MDDSWFDIDMDNLFDEVMLVFYAEERIRFKQKERKLKKDYGIFAKQIKRKKQ